MSNLSNTAAALDSLAAQIQEKMEAGNRFAQQAVSTYMEVGLLLCEARDLHPGDLQFGQWRAKALPNVQAGWSTKLMQVARDKRLHGPEMKDFNISALAEMASAPDEVIQQLVDQSKEDGKPPTIKEIRIAKKPDIEEEKIEAIEGELLPTPEESATNEAVQNAAVTAKRQTDTSLRGPANQPAVVGPSMEQKAAELVELSLRERLVNFGCGNDDPDEGIKTDPFVAMGLGSGMCETAPNTEVMADVYEMLRSKVETWEDAETMLDVLSRVFEEACDLAEEIRDMHVS